ncbi:MAG: ABC transporter permease [Oscillospiraceae bacterium]|nr:ABC transporter permease [Oscillospiraceae bacterium]
MVKYTIKRLVMIIPITLVVILVLFLMLYLVAGSSMTQLRIYGGGDMLDRVFERFKASENFFTKYIRYCYNVIVHLDFGRSSATRLRLIGELDYRVKNTMLLLATGVGATLLIGIPLGVVAAVRKNRPLDRIINVISLLLSAIPSYSMAIAVTLILAVYLRILPVVISYISPLAYIMPMITLSLGGIASIARMSRASMIEELEQPYITALRSKGLRERTVIYKHALKNALVPVISSLGGLIAQLLCGTFVVEHFFNVPGLGSYMLRSVGSRSHLEILGCTIIMTMILAVTNVLTDVLYSLVNPQIKLRYSRGSSRMRLPPVVPANVRKEAAE